MWASQKLLAHHPKKARNSSQDQLRQLFAGIKCMAEFCHWLNQEVHKLSSAAERKPVRLVKSQQETTKRQVCTELEAAERQCPGVLYFHKSLHQTSHRDKEKTLWRETLWSHESQTARHAANSLLAACLGPAGKAQPNRRGLTYLSYQGVQYKPLILNPPTIKALI